MRNEIILRFGIWGFDDMTHDEISKVTELVPTKIYIKGQKKNINFSVLSKENGWLYQPTKDVYSSFEEQLNLLLMIIENKRSVFEDLCKKYSCEISCGVYIYIDIDESMPSIHLDSRYHKTINNLNISFDLDIYCLQST